jgi:glutathione S-transferase kappa 1
MSSKKVLVELFYDVVSPYSWVAFEMLCRYRPEWQSMALKLKPFSLGTVMKESGNNPPLMVPNKSKYMLKDLQRINDYYKIPIVIPKNFIEVAIEKTTLKPQRFITAIDMITKGDATEEISRQLWKRVFVAHQDVTLPDSLRKAAKSANISEEVAEKALVAMEQNETKEQLKNNTKESLSYGAFGAPTIVLHLPKGPQMVFGSDRMEIIGSMLGEKYLGPLHKYSKL